MKIVTPAKMGQDIGITISFVMIFQNISGHTVHGTVLERIP